MATEFPDPPNPETWFKVSWFIFSNEDKNVVNSAMWARVWKGASLEKIIATNMGITDPYYNVRHINENIWDYRRENLEFKIKEASTKGWTTDLGDGVSLEDIVEEDDDTEFEV